MKLSKEEIGLLGLLIGILEWIVIAAIVILRPGILFAAWEVVVMMAGGFVVLALTFAILGIIVSIIFLEVGIIEKLSIEFSLIGKYTSDSPAAGLYRTLHNMPKLSRKDAAVRILKEQLKLFQVFEKTSLGKKIGSILQRISN